MSFAQERLWFLQQLDPASAAYHIPLVFRVSGRLDVDALDQALRELVARHDALRTTFEVIDEEPVQIVADSVAVTIERCRGTAEEARAAAGAHSLTPFDLRRGPLLRVLLASIDDGGDRDDLFLLAITVHHIVADGWSMGIMRRELAALYASFARGEEPALSDPELQYPDFAVWQREERTEELARQVEHWKSRLEGAPALELPTDHTRSTSAGHGGVLTRSLGSAATAELSSLAKRAGTTLAMIAVAATSLVLARHSGQNDFVVGVPIAGRNRSELEGVVGLFVNTLPVRVRMTEDDTLASLLATIKSSMLEAYDNQDVPFERLVAELNPERDLTRSPIVQVLVNVLSFGGGAELDLGGLVFTPEAGAEGEAKVDLDLYISPAGETIDATLRYDADIFSVERIEEILAQVLLVLVSFGADSSVRLDAVELVTDRARALLPDPRAVIDEPPQETLGALFASAARTHEARTAITHAGRSYSYGALDRASARIAAWMASRGAVVGEVVAVSGARSFGLVATMLAAFRGGFSLLALDPRVPDDRRRAMLSVAKAKLTIDVGVDVGTEGEVDEAPAIALDAPPPDGPAYVFFTSGTTGTPKGVVGRQRGLGHFLAWERRRFEIGPGDVVGQLTGLSFDVVLRDVFVGLVSGATLALPPPAVEDLAGEEVLPWLAREGITILHTVPSLAQAWLASDPSSEIISRSLRRVLFAGEPLPAALVASWRARFPACAVGNLYGPTETTLAKCFFEVPPSPFPGIQPVGTAMPGAQALVVSSTYRTCGVGEVGEIVIRTPFRSLGYLAASQDDLARFTANPFRDDPADVVYRTGDRGRLFPDGTLQILGRVDHQVKIRGVRIEPAEITAVLVSHPAVATALVIGDKDARGETFLAAYVVLRAAKAETSELRAFLEAKLLPQMIPDTFVVLSEMPLSPNGKIDRGRLPRTSKNREERPHVAPRDALEEAIAAIWIEVLGIPQISVIDSFFHVGGHSLLAARVAARIRATLAVDVTVRALFEAPTVAGLAQHVRSAQSGDSVRVAEHVPSVVAEGNAAPLSFAQERMWFLTQLKPDSWAYHVPIAFSLRGPIDALAVSRALDAFIARHAMLRTRFIAIDGEPRQIIDGPKGLEIETENVDESELADRVSALARRPFHLEREAGFRAALFAIAPDHHVVVAVVHHIVFDAWSMGIFLSELPQLYAKEIGATDVTLAPLAVTYADFAIWQREQLDGQRLRRQLAYWKERLAGAPNLALPLDRARPAVQTHAPGAWASELGPPVVRALRELCRKESVTPFMALFAALAAVLGRYAGQEDVSIGTPIANRGLPELERVVGFFVNTLVLRLDLAGTPTFTELLARAKEASLGAYANQDVPFERVVDHVSPERDPSMTPLYQVELVLHNTPREERVVAGVTMDRLVLEAREVKFDLSLAVVEREDRLVLHWEYNADLFDAASIAQLASHFALLAERAFSSPKKRVGGIPLLSAAERAAILGATTSAPAASIGGVHCFFERSAAANPAAIAVSGFGESLTYASLDRRASAVARSLARAGVGRGAIVAVSAERSLAMVIAVLAALKVGAAYAPIDPSYPPERIRQMIEDAGVTVALTTAATDSSMRAFGIATIPVGADEGGDAAPGLTVSADDLAYVIFTSGSTGRPKGVAMRHGALENLVTWQTVRLPRAGPRVLQFASLSFDVSFQELFTTWNVGGTVFLVDDDTRRDARALLRFVAREQIERIFLPFVALQQMAEETDVPVLSLREIITAGEQLRITPAVARFFEKARARLFNQYGPSETHVVTELALADDPTSWETLPSIGRAIDAVSTFVLDERLEPVPAGVVGELYLGGANLARGYVGRPDLTSARFVPSPFGDGERLYRTGDLAATRRSGEIIYLGRADQQVKVRGFRVELGEVEAAIEAAPGVAAAVVVARGAGAATKRLVAFVTADGALDLRELVAFTKKRLPEYMVPSRILIRDRFPLGPSGKVNRLALATEPLEEEARKETVAPRDAIEEALVEIWRELLETREIGIDDSFFDLGGHSLLAARAVSRTRSVLGVDLAVLALFENPTVRALAVVVRDANEDLRRERPPFERASVRSPAPLSYSQERFFFLHRLAPRSPAYNVARVLQIVGALDDAALERALGELVSRHETLRTTYHDETGGPVAVIDEGGAFSLRREVIGTDARLEEVVDAEVRAPFDLGRGPVLRATLLSAANGDRVLILVMHHIAVDGWSLQILSNELAALYAAFSSGRPSPLGALAFDYADYAAWQRGWLAGDVMDRQLAYWKDALEGAPVLDLPVDFARPPFVGFDGASCPVTLDGELVADIRSVARAAGATPFMVLLAAYALVLGYHAGQRDVVVGTPVANRALPETEPMVGVFINTLALRITLPDDATFVDLLRRVRETTLHAYAHQDAPFETVVEAVSPERDASRTALFQALLMLQNIGSVGPDVALGDETVSFVPFGRQSGSTKYEVSLHLFEGGDRISGTLAFRTDLFARPTIERMVARFVQVLAAAVRSPQAKLAELPLLLASERARLGSPPPPAASTTTIPALFERVAQRVPDRLAVVAGADRLDFAELERRSRALAQGFLAKGTRREEVVLVVAPRSIELVIGLLGVMRAGASAALADPSTPDDRLRALSAEVGARFVVGSIGAERMAALGLEAIAPSEVPGALPVVAPSQAAYVIFTSGSTGTPKGVVVEHRQLVSYLEGLRERLALDELEHPSYAMVSSVAADLGHTALFPPLVFGGTLHLFDAEVAMSPPRFAENMRNATIDILKIVPSHLRALVGEAPTSELLPRRRLVLGGEAARRPWLDALALAMPTSARLFNHYGPTETTVGVLAGAADLESPARRALGALALGRPLAHATAHVLDHSMRPIAPGLVGELYVGGSQVARGYQGRPDLTAGRFVPDPFSDVGGRLYRTGDRVRQLDDGAYFFLGRADDQIKVRGFRIELGEVEAALRSAPGVTDAIVLARTDLGAELALVGYVVGEAAAAAVRAHVTSRLPAHMVPESVVVLPSLPITKNGKIDRRALPKPEKLEGTFVAPRSDEERAVASAFAATLGLARVGATDRFFALGGTSMGALQLIGALHRGLSVIVPVSAIFADDSVEGIARVVASASTAATTREERAVVVLQGAGKAVPFFCVHPHAGNLVPYRELAEACAPDQPLYGLQAPGLAGEDTPLESLEDFARVYADGIRRVRPHGPYVVGGWSAGGRVAFQVARLLRATGDEVIVVVVDSGRPEASAMSSADAELLRDWLSIARSRRITLAELDAVRPSHLRAVLVELGASATTELSADDLAMLDVFRGMSAALGTESAGSFDGHVVYVRGTRAEPEVSRRKLAWRDHARTFELVDVDATHADIVLGAHARTVADVIRRVARSAGGEVRDHAGGVGVDAVDEPGLPPREPRKA